ncbi:MAG: hypothetical protein U0235_00630 [Polyangiaceae bacterium]
MRSLTPWLSALLLVGALGCSAASSDEDVTDDALTAEQASTELAELVAHPETSLRGVGDPVLRVQGKEELWSFYPYHPDTTVKTAATVADDEESAFLVVGSSGAILLIDVTTGAGAASVPEGTTAQEVAARLQADMHAMNATSATANESSTSSVHTNALPGAGLVTALRDKLTTTTEKIADKLKEGGFVARAVAATKEKASQVAGYFMGHESTSTAPPATTTTPTTTTTTTPAAPSTTAPTEPASKVSKLLKGPAEVALAIAKLAKRTVTAIENKVTGTTPSAEDRAIPVESVTTEPTSKLSLRRPSDADFLKTKTSAEVAVNAKDATALVDKRPDTVWTPGADPADIVQSWTGSPPHAEVLVGDDIEKSSLQKLKDAGHKAVWVVKAETVKAIEEVKADLPFHKDEPIAETRSDGATRAVLSAAKTYLVKAWDESLLKMSDEAFMKTPIFQAIDALASRHANGDELPKIDLVGDGVAGDLLAATIKRATELLKKLGVEIADDLVLPAIHGAKPSATPPKPTTPTTPTMTRPPLRRRRPRRRLPAPMIRRGRDRAAPADEPVLLPPTSSQKPDAGTKRAAKPQVDSGCSVSGTSRCPDLGGAFVVGLAALCVRRRRR